MQQEGLAVKPFTLPWTVRETIPESHRMNIIVPKLKTQQGGGTGKPSSKSLLDSTKKRETEYAEKTQPRVEVVASFFLGVGRISMEPAAAVQAVVGIVIRIKRADLSQQV